jgi:hypothetical protein
MISTLAIHSLLNFPLTVGSHAMVIL